MERTEKLPAAQRQDGIHCFGTATHGAGICLRTLIGLLWLVPVWPAIAAVMLWYRLRLRKQILSQSRTCPKCGKETLREMSAQEIKKDARLFTPQERMELNLQTVCIHVYTCTDCGEKVKVRIPLATGLYEYCPGLPRYHLTPERSIHCGEISY